MSSRYSAVPMNDGVTCGTNVASTVCHLPAPVEVTASRDIASVFSTASVKSLPTMPMEWIAKASKPGSGPMPSGNVSTAASTRVGSARVRVMMARATANTTGFGVVLRAAMNASGILSTTQAVVPINAIQIVSTVAFNTTRMLSKLGGTMSTTRFHSSVKPPKSVSRVMSMYVHDHTTPTT